MSSSIVVRDLAEVQGFVHENGDGEACINTAAVITGSSDSVGCTDHIGMDGLSDDEIGELEIDERELPAAIEALQALVQVKNEPEPELFHDTSPELYDDNGLEESLSGLIDVQESMAKVMRLIDKANEEISARFERFPWFGKLYKAWAGTLDKEVAARFLTDPRNKFHVQWLDYRKNLWNKWWMLKGACDRMTKDDTRLWPAYFKLAEFEFNPYFTSGEIDEDVDDKALWSVHLDRGADLAWDHVRQMTNEQEAIDSPLKSWEEVTPKTGGFVPFCRTIRKESTEVSDFVELSSYEEEEGYLASLMQEAAFIVTTA